MSTVKFKPMLAASCDDLDQLKYPLLATPKIDGIRCIIIDGVAMSRSLKPIPNAYIQSILGRADFNGLDGELLVGNTFQHATSGIMSEDGTPAFTFHVFDDCCRPELSYVNRVFAMKQRYLALRNSAFVVSEFLQILMPVTLRSREELDAYSAQELAKGFEGVMVRLPSSPYKQGRATFKEGYLTKIKPFEDAEATVIGFEERMHNGNEATTNALGRTERSSHKENLVPMGTLGALICSNQAKWPGVTFNLGTGFDDATRAYIWANRDRAIGTTVKFKYQAIGTVDKPRIPVFEGFRSAEDMS